MIILIIVSPLPPHLIVDIDIGATLILCVATIVSIIASIPPLSLSLHPNPITDHGAKGADRWGVSEGTLG